MPRQLSDQTLEIWRLCELGHPNSEIERIMGLSQSSVAHAVYRGRKKGVLPKVRFVHEYELRVEGKLRRGSICNILDGLDEEQRKLIVDQARKLECASIAEYILEIVRDAFFEEDGKLNLT